MYMLALRYSECRLRRCRIQRVDRLRRECRLRCCPLRWRVDRLPSGRQWHGMQAASAGLARCAQACLVFLAHDQACLVYLAACPLVFLAHDQAGLVYLAQQKDLEEAAHEATEEQTGPRPKQAASPQAVATPPRTFLKARQDLEAMTRPSALATMTRLASKDKDALEALPVDALHHCPLASGALAGTPSPTRRCPISADSSRAKQEA